MRRAMIAMVLAVAVFGGTVAGAADGQPAIATPVREPDVRYEPSPMRVVRAMLKLADVTPNDVVYDLGSGDGRVPIMAAQAFGARAVGIEIDPDLVARARGNAERAGVAGRVTFRNEDLFEADLGDATVVTLFLSPSVNTRLRPRLLAELRPGARIVSHYHDMDDWKPERRIHVDGRPVYLWIVPERGN